MTSESIRLRTIIIKYLPEAGKLILLDLYIDVPRFALADIVKQFPALRYDKEFIKLWQE